MIFSKKHQRGDALLRHRTRHTFLRPCHALIPTRSALPLAPQSGPLSWLCTLACAPSRLFSLTQFLLFVSLKSFIEMWFTCHAIQAFEVDRSTVFRIFRNMCHWHHKSISECCRHLRKKPHPYLLAITPVSPAHPTPSLLSVSVCPCSGLSSF